METTIIDSSVLLAIMQNEPESETYHEFLRYSVISSVNVAEVAGVLMARHNMPKNDTINAISQLVDNVINFTSEHAYISAEFEIVNKKNAYGLSLGDRACITLGVMMDGTIYTTDKIWQKVSFKNAKIKVLR